MKSLFALILLVLLALGFVVSTYRLGEFEQAVITRFGDPVANPVVKESGLHFKIPFITEVHRLEKRILAWDGTTQDMVTAGQKNISIDTTARWQIEDPLGFYKRLGTQSNAQSRLDDMLHEVVQTIVARTDLSEIVRSKDWSVDQSELDRVVRPEDDSSELVKEVRTGREQLENQMREEAAKQVEDFGIKLMDLRIKRINYVNQVQQRVFQRMISERKRIATKFRQEGREEADRIRANADREVAEILSEARRQSEVIRGLADAEATRIYSEAYQQGPAFFSFTRTLDSYRKTLGNNSVLMLSTDSDYFYFLEAFEEEAVGEVGR